MAKDYSDAFYHGRQWRTVRAAYLASVHYLCERCGSPAKIVHHKDYISPENIHDCSITLDWGNLEALCQDCHNKEHFESGSTAKGLKFDRDGNLVKTG